MTVGIVGLGLIGGSMAKSIKARTAHTVFGCDLDQETMMMARMCGAIDAPLTAENLKDCDLVLVAIRPAAAVKWVKEHAEGIRRDAILVDLCGVKRAVVRELAPVAEQYGFAYGMTGTLLSLMSVGNLLAGLLMGMLPSALGMKRSVLLLTIGYAVGYAIMGLTGAVVLLAAAFFVVGIAKGSVINTCTILVSDHSADRTRGMNTMHSANIPKVIKSL